MPKYVVTGSSGLVGGAMVGVLCRNNYNTVIGVDNNMRRKYFGEHGSTHLHERYLQNSYSNYKSANIDIREHKHIRELIEHEKPNAVIHCAAQPSHERAASMIIDDFNINAVATVNLLDSVKTYCPESPFVFMSTNKVYGNAPNEISYEENDKRYEFKKEVAEYMNGIGESMRIDSSTHSYFGASKLAADIMVQEFGRYSDIPTCCLRAGCITGPWHAGVEDHGFLNYLIGCYIKGKEYTIYGYKGKQVRDIISSSDVAEFISNFIESPSPGAVFNIGGGYENSTSILEIIAKLESIGGKKMSVQYSDKTRKGDHRIYYSDNSKISSSFPDWHIKEKLDSMIEQIYTAYYNDL